MFDFDKYDIPLISKKTEDFIIGLDDFSTLEIRRTENALCYFYDRKNNRLIKNFLLGKSSKGGTSFICQVTLIKGSADKLTPRLSFSSRNDQKKIESTTTTVSTNIKASVILHNHHANFWKLMDYLRVMPDLEMPEQVKFSLSDANNDLIIAAMMEKSSGSIKKVIEQLIATRGVEDLSPETISILLGRKEKLKQFHDLLKKDTLEPEWQSFFDSNKWIFGYGLDYRVMKHVENQPHYGGTDVAGTGAQKGDNLLATVGDLSFTVLVEIKRHTTPLLRGTEKIRNGAWSLSEEVSDALVQIQANVDTWEKEGSQLPRNVEKLDTKKTHTVKPKGILLIGQLSQLEGEKDKRETFQRFRSSINGVDVITFDELYARAKFIVDHNEN